MTDATQATDLIRITSRLIGVLEREIENVRLMRPSEIQVLQQEKSDLTAALEAEIAALRRDAAAIEQIAPALRQELRTAMEKFQTTLARSVAETHAAKDATDRVLHAIAAELQERSRASRPYADNRGAPQNARLGRDPVSLTFNQSV